MSKEIQLSTAAATLAKKTKAFVVIHLDSDGVCTMAIDGNMLETAFMLQCLQVNNMKSMNDASNSMAKGNK